MKHLKNCIFLFCSVVIFLTVTSSLLFAQTSHQSTATPIPFREVVIDSIGPDLPWMKAIGDINGDEQPDLIVAGRIQHGWFCILMLHHI